MILVRVILLGGLTKDDPAISVLLRSGDTVLLSNQSRLCYHGVSRIFDCPYTSNYRRESGRKRGKCSASCLPICCENKSIEHHPITSTSSEIESYHNMDDFLWKNEVSSEIIHESLEGIHCSMRRNSSHNNSHDALNKDNQSCPCCGKSVLSKEEERKVLNYLRFSRINLNVRQVYPSPSPSHTSP